MSQETVEVVIPGRSSCRPRTASATTEPLEVVQACEHETAMQLKWLRTRMKQAAPQALVAP